MGPGPQLSTVNLATTMATTIPSAITSMITAIPKLDDSNWFTWIKKMKMIFLAAGLEGIISGSPPTDTDQRTRWDTLNRQMLAYLYIAISDDFQYLVEDETTASDGWIKLQEYFQRSTFGARMMARREFYEITHDSSRPLSQYIHSVTAAKKKLESLGCTVSDTELKDVLLIHLHSSYDPVRITILAQKTEPSLDDIKIILTSSAASDGIITKTEPVDEVLVTCIDHSKKAIPVDDKGFRWCDTDRDGVCHRCGRSGHIAARCMYNMPQLVKDWIMSSRFPLPSSSVPEPKEPDEQAGYVYSSLSDPLSGDRLGPILL